MPRVGEAAELGVVVVTGSGVEIPVVVTGSGVEVPVVVTGSGVEVPVDATVTPGQPDGKFELPPLTYRSNCQGPPHMAVPVLVAPILPLHTSVHACAPVRLKIDDPWKLKVLPP